MERIIKIIARIVTAALTCMLLVAGCSQDNPVDPTGNSIGAIAQSVDPELSDNGLAEPTFVETFDSNSNEGGFSFFGAPGNPVEIFEEGGGNPGAYLHATCGQYGCLSTFAPQLRTPIGEPSIFTGNYRAKKVTKVGVDIAIFGCADSGWRPLSLLLRNENGTPYDFSDDIQVFWTGNKMIPMPNGVFKEFNFFIPSESDTIPKGWQVLPGYGSGDDDADWNKVITDVSQITFFFGDPMMFFMLQSWELGVDNTRIWLDN